MSSYEHIPATFTDDKDPNSMSGNGLEPVRDTESFGDILNSNASLQIKLLRMFNAVKARVASVYSQLRPWGEFFDRAYLGAPAGVGEAISRFSTNFRYFYPNYVLLAMCCSSYVLLMNVSFSICLLAALVFYYYIQSEIASLTARGSYLGVVTVFGKPYSTVQLYIFIGIYALLAFYFTNGSSVLFWLTVTTLGVITPHAMCRRPALVDPGFQFA